MFTTRLLSGVILVVLAVLIVGAGGSILFAVNGAVSMMGLFELYRVLKIERTPLAAIGYGACAVYYGLIWFDGHEYVTLLAIGVLMCLMSFYVFTFPKYKTEEVTAAFFGVFYVAVMLSYLYQVRQMPSGAYLVWLIFFSSWGCDTCAYCAGKLFGRHKMTPVLSPKKTIEGAIGGMAGSAALGYAYAAVLGQHMMELRNPCAACALACGIAALISQVGDLAASAIKRNHQVKDYGHLIPGHGGILDRFDSMIFTAPAIYLVITLVR
ncbi:MAG: phosphatidate cytidylyltransferase [Hungatella sp.]|nr:phosphatidate cytidylyltransferase [Hungatella sp.]